MQNKKEDLSDGNSRLFVSFRFEDARIYVNEECGNSRSMKKSMRCSWSNTIVVESSNFPFNDEFPGVWRSYGQDMVWVVKSVKTLMHS